MYKYILLFMATYFINYISLCNHTQLNEYYHNVLLKENNTILYIKILIYNDIFL